MKRKPTYITGCGHTPYISLDNYLLIKIFKNVKCRKCGRKYPQTVLNYEGMLHHHTGPICLNYKNCNRYTRKLLNKDN